MNNFFGDLFAIFFGDVTFFMPEVKVREIEKRKKTLVDDIKILEAKCATVKNNMDMCTKDTRHWKDERAKLIALLKRLEFKKNSLSKIVSVEDVVTSLTDVKRDTDIIENTIKETNALLNEGGGLKDRVVRVNEDLADTQTETNEIMEEVNILHGHGAMPSASDELLLYDFMEENSAKSPAVKISPVQPNALFKKTGVFEMPHIPASPPRKTYGSFSTSDRKIERKECRFQRTESLTPAQ